MFTRASWSTPRSRPLIVALGAVLAAAVMSVVFFMPGLVSASHGLPHGTILARGPFADATDVQLRAPVGGKPRVMNVQNARDVIVQQVTVDVGTQTGWHSHPGPVVVVVAAGSMTLYQADDPTCTGRTYNAGQSFVDPGQGNVHNARNEGGAQVQMYATYFDVPAGAGPAIPAANPGTCTGF